MSSKLSAVAYVAGAILFGVVGGTARENPSDFAAWLGAATAAPLAGLVVAVIAHWLRPSTNVPKWIFWVALIVFAMNSLPKTPAP